MPVTSGLPLIAFANMAADAIKNINIASDADVDPDKLLYTSMGAWMRKTTSQAIVTSTLTPVTFADGEAFDLFPSGFTQLHDTGSNPSRIIARKLGIWMLAGLLSYEGATGTGTDRYAYLTKNGATVIAPWRTVTHASIPIGVMAVGFTNVTAVTDYLELQAYQGQGSNVNVGDFGSGTFFGAVWIGNNT
jgi:hypothetical protein